MVFTFVEATQNKSRKNIFDNPIENGINRGFSHPMCLISESGHKPTHRASGRRKSARNYFTLSHLFLSGAGRNSLSPIKAHRQSNYPGLREKAETFIFSGQRHLGSIFSKEKYLLTRGGCMTGRKSGALRLNGNE